ncbi:hypothetical protein PMIN03_009174 [Paraphaeosphaeria minitans]
MDARYIQCDPRPYFGLETRHEPSRDPHHILSAPLCIDVLHALRNLPRLALCSPQTKFARVSSHRSNSYTQHAQCGSPSRLPESRSVASQHQKQTTEPTTSEM